MEKTTVYLTSMQKEALARTAAAEGRSEALLIRAGIDVVTAGHRAAEAAAHLAPSASALAPSTAARPRWIGREEFVRSILSRQADPGLRSELRVLAPDSTDEVPLA
ncbi:MAG: hypothetical protein WCK58_02835 [Chloroflexota bacterium]